MMIHHTCVHISMVQSEPDHHLNDHAVLAIITLANYYSNLVIIINVAQLKKYLRSYMYLLCIHT